MKNRIAGGVRSNARKMSHFFLSSYGKSDNSLFTGFLSIKKMHTATRVNTQ